MGLGSHCCVPLGIRCLTERSFTSRRIIEFVDQLVPLLVSALAVGPSPLALAKQFKEYCMGAVVAPKQQCDDAEATIAMGVQRLDFMNGMIPVYHVIGERA